MQIQESGEMYLESIVILSERLENVRAVDVANFTGYSKPSVSQALSILKSNDLIQVADNGYITLTRAGSELADKVYEKHRVLTQFFLKIGVSDETAERDACRIEHVISDETFEKLRDYIYDYI